MSQTSAWNLYFVYIVFTEEGCRKPVRGICILRTLYSLRKDVVKQCSEFVFYVPRIH